MRWAVFAIIAFAIVALQLSLAGALTLHTVGGLKPNLVAALAVFIALFAHRTSVLWGCWLLGLMLDLGPAATPGPVHVIGPHALGYVFGGFLILQLRSMVFRRRALTLGFLTFVFMVGAAVVAIFILGVRSFYPGESPMPGGALSELVRRMGTALYSGLLAIPFGWLLLTTFPLWNFQSGMPRRTA